MRKRNYLLACQEQRGYAGWLEWAILTLKWEMGGSKDKGTCFTLSHSWDTTPKVCLPWSATITKHFNAYLTIFPFLFAHSFLGSAWRCFLSVSGLMLKRFQVNFQRGFKISEDCILAQKIGNHDVDNGRPLFYTQVQYLSMKKQVGKIMPNWKPGEGVIDAQVQDLILQQQTTDLGKKKEWEYLYTQRGVCVCACTYIHTYTSHTVLGYDVKSLYHSACPIICLV